MMRFFITNLIILAATMTLNSAPRKQIKLPLETPYEPYVVRLQKRPLDGAPQQYNVVLTEALAEARAVLRYVKPKGKETVIFDIDDTLLNTTQPSGTSAYLWSEQLLLFYQAIPEVLAFYNELKSRGFKLILLSGRLTKSTIYARCDDVLSATTNNLCEAGYTGYERVICMPFEERKKYRIGYWKEMMRKKLVDEGKYDIFLTIDDDPYNLVGDNLGYPIEIPSKQLRMEKQ